ncbi:hypothetical protein J4E08_06490 [Sagittula sp. NFXS13]|uniref:hypothetical protein n=1 Tax=Sagittula sp. NFXS13 TaxID=2819095 RepID=UPI0032DF2C45
MNVLTDPWPETSARQARITMLPPERRAAMIQALSQIITARITDGMVKVMRAGQ